MTDIKPTTDQKTEEQPIKESTVVDPKEKEEKEQERKQILKIISLLAYDIRKDWSSHVSSIQTRTKKLKELCEEIGETEQAEWIEYHKRDIAHDGRILRNSFDLYDFEEDVELSEYLIEEYRGVFADESVFDR